MYVKITTEVFFEFEHGPLCAQPNGKFLCASSCENAWQNVQEFLKASCAFPASFSKNSPLQQIQTLGENWNVLP